MNSNEIENTLFIVTGSCLKAERMDRPLAGRVREEAQNILQESCSEEPDIVILGDIWYLNSKELHQTPTISVGGPGVNHVSAYWQSRLPFALLVENVLQIQMDVGGSDHRCCVWGMDHELTVEAVDTFLIKGHLMRFLSYFPELSP
ncbi:MAG: hypothetical protein GXP29_07975 [Planctomycetes bacterium]|nr:hypothetical protein [Planctomycetota bacterium]